MGLLMCLCTLYPLAMLVKVVCPQLGFGGFCADLSLLDLGHFVRIGVPSSCLNESPRQSKFHVCNLQALVEEKETKAKETMLIMGLRPWIFNAAWWMTYAVSCTVNLNY